MCTHIAHMVRNVACIHTHALAETHRPPRTPKLHDTPNNNIAFPKLVVHTHTIKPLQMHPTICFARKTHFMLRNINALATICNKTHVNAGTTKHLQRSQHPHQVVIPLLPCAQRMVAPTERNPSNIGPIHTQYGTPHKQLHYMPILLP